MGTNGKSEVKPPEIDAEHELAPGEGGDDPVPLSSPMAAGAVAEEADLEKARAELGLLRDRMARMQADFENARKRAAREQREFRDFALADAVKTLLPVVDSFERALEIGAEEKSEFHDGVELIYKQLLDALNKMGVQPIAARGEWFDPHLHQAIEMVDTAEAEDQRVLEELQRGYKLKDRLLRPAMVRVARNSK
jgi:molecular chaperone GrpE